MKRDIIKIDEELCDGCGLCIPNCHEGALQIIDGKARLLSDLMCDGLGACIGHCPQDALKIEQREAEAYDEKKVMEDMISKGKNVVIAHLKHLQDHNETQFLEEGMQYLENNTDKLDFNIQEVITSIHKDEITMEKNENSPGCGCMGSQEMSFDTNEKAASSINTSELKSELRQWPVQMHLINPDAQYFKNADVVITADCVAFALGNYHQKYLKGKTIGIACPKLDSQTEIYIEKFRKMVDEAMINTFTVMIMEVPCCGGLITMIQSAIEKAGRKIPVKLIVVRIQGDILKEEWI